MTPQPSYVSVIDPIGPAIERVKTVLFRPFDLERWFIIGFCAWLAQLGQNGGGGGGNMGRAVNGAGEMRNEVGRAYQNVLDNLYWIVPVAIIVFVIIIGLWLLVAWLSSRGRFMFLYCVAQNKAEVKNPWHQFAEHGDRLFGFRVVLGLIAFAVMAVLAAVVGVMVYFAQANGVNALAILGAVAGALFLVAAIIGFFLYLLFQIVIGLVVSAILMTGVCITCGCLCCLSALPYVGTVVLLPIFVFQRSYSLFYLSQYGSEFNVFAWPPEPAAPAEPSPQF